MTADSAVARPAARPVALPWLGLGIGLTAFDAIATLVWLELGVALEGNPLLRVLVERIGAAPAMAVRLLVGVTLLVALARLAGRSRLARHGLPAMTVVLAAVALWHVVGGLAAV